MPSLQSLVDGVRSSDRAFLGRAITLVESSLPEHREIAQELLNSLMSDTGDSLRVGIPGVPGVGKSTFIESLGKTLNEPGHCLSVLAVVPNSSRPGV